MNLTKLKRIAEAASSFLPRTREVRQFNEEFTPAFCLKLLAVAEKESCANAALVCDQDVALEYALEKLEDGK